MLSHKLIDIKNQSILFLDIAKIKDNLNVHYQIHPHDARVSFAIGDLHGNALKLVRFLIEIGIIDLQLEGLSSIYMELKNAYINKEQRSFRKCLDKIKFDERRTKKAKLILIGDTLCDRGNSDCMTMLVFRKMSKAGVKYTICLSNHDTGFIIKMTKTHDLLRCGRNVKEASPSVSYDGGNLDTNSKKVLIHMYNEYYLKNLKVMEYEKVNETEIVYSHAPCNWDEIRKIKLVTEEYTNLSSTISMLNASLAKVIKEGKFNYRWIKENNLIDFVWTKDLKVMFTDNVLNVFGHVGDQQTNSVNQVNLDTDFGKQISFTGQDGRRCGSSLNNYKLPTVEDIVNLYNIHERKIERYQSDLKNQAQKLYDSSGDLKIFLVSGSITETGKHILRGLKSGRPILEEYRQQQEIARQQIKNDLKLLLRQKNAKMQILLNELETFVRTINNASSKWYKGLGHSNRKGRTLEQILTILSIDHYDEIFDIIQILQVVIKIALIPRGETTNLNKIKNLRNPKETKTARKALILLSLPEYKNLSQEIKNFLERNFLSTPVNVITYNHLFTFAFTTINELYLHKDEIYSHARHLIDKINARFY
ncbi:calcineurin-like phosphoesterase family protein [Allofrancisella inopinata]|uniref:WipA-like phosphatase domain-containing protein n=1 Tax=Allofrancisella inopinata TaxID=1085647 RepID=A0AAE6YH71_9GAMM|nr:metallophosphoesterase [Allofrancisella inopinata]QIV95833.1 hypothetical protein E4K63_02905 [Allofrancisella inopinata]TDT72873.1 calcineurin-like phosphoesterase family protein [Allofrancisella inopinata]